MFMPIYTEMGGTVWAGFGPGQGQETGPSFGWEPSPKKYAHRIITPKNAGTAC